MERRRPDLIIDSRQTETPARQPRSFSCQVEQFVASHLLHPLARSLDCVTSRHVTHFSANKNRVSRINTSHSLAAVIGTTFFLTIFLLPLLDPVSTVSHILQNIVINLNRNSGLASYFDPINSVFDLCFGCGRFWTAFGFAIFGMSLLRMQL